MNANPFELPRTKIGQGGVRLINVAGATHPESASGKALHLYKNSSLNISGVAADITMTAPLQVSSGEFNVTNGAVASVCLQGLDHNLSINEGSSLNVVGGSTLI